MNNKKNKTEYVSRDILSTSLIRCFAPIHLAQLALGSSRIHIRHKFATESTVWQKAYSAVCVLLTSLSIYKLVSLFYAAYSAVNTTMLVTCTGGVAVQYCSYLLHIFYIRFRRHSDPRLYEMLHKVDRSLCLSRLDSFNERHFYFNVFSVIFVTVSLIGGFTYGLFTLFDDSILTIFFGFAMVSICLELLLTGSCIYYLIVRLEFFNDILKVRLQICDPIDKMSRVKYLYAVKELNKMDINNIFETFDIIIQTFRIIVSLIKFPVLNLVTSIYLWTFILIESVVIGLSTKLIPVVTAVMACLWITFNFVQLWAVSASADSLRAHLAGTKALCVRALSCSQDGPVYAAAKRMLITMECEGDCVSVYGMFPLDAKLPARLLALVATNVIIWVQLNI